MVGCLFVSFFLCLGGGLVVCEVRFVWLVGWLFVRLLVWLVVCLFVRL